MQVRTVVKDAGLGQRRGERQAKIQEAMAALEAEAKLVA
jgi:hypothetical protein